MDRVMFFPGNAYYVFLRIAIVIDLIVWNLGWVIETRCEIKVKDDISR